MREAFLRKFSKCIKQKIMKLNKIIGTYHTAMKQKIIKQMFLKFYTK